MKCSDLVRTGAAAVLAVALAALPAAAKNGAGNTKVKPVKVASAKPASAGPKAKAPKGPKAQAPKAAKTQAPKGAQTAKASGPTTTKSASRTKGSSRNDRNGDGTPATSLQDFADNTPTPGTVPQSKAQEKLANNLKLRQRMRMRLGADPMAAAAGFKNLGQFVAAVNVSNNQGIDFNLLKGLMVNRGMSLGQAIQTAKAIEARRATSLANAALVQANDEITATSLVSVTNGKNKGS